MSDSIVYVNPTVTIANNIAINQTGSSTTTITANSPSASPQTITIDNIAQEVTVTTVGIAGPAGSTLPAHVIGMSGDQITVDGVVTGPHLTGTTGHSPVVSMSGDRITIDGTAVGPHLTGVDGHTSVISMSGDQITVDGNIVGPHLTGTQGAKGDTGEKGNTGDTSTVPGPPGNDGHSPVITMPSDQVVVDGVPIGLHLTGPKGDKGDIGITGNDGHSPVITMTSDQVTVDGSIIGPHLTGTSGTKGDKGDTGDKGTDGNDGHSPTVSMSGDQITVDAVVVGPHLTGPPGNIGNDGHSPVVSMVDDQITVDSVVIGPHLTGPQGPSVPPDWNASSGPGAIAHKPTLGTASPLNISTSGNAASTEVVIGSDSRLTNSRTPTAHANSHALGQADEITITQSQVTDLVTLLGNLKYGVVTGVLAGGTLSVNSEDPTKLDVSTGKSLYTNFSDTENPVIEKLTWSNVTLNPNLSNVTSRLWLGIQRASANTASFIFEEEFTALEKRGIAVLGRVWSNTSAPTVIEGIGQYTTPAFNDYCTLIDLIDTLGSLNKDGNIFSPNDDNLLLNKSSGHSFRFSANFSGSPTSPNIQNDSSLTAISAYHYHIYNAGSTTLKTTIDPEYYDVNGTLTSVPSTKFTVQRIYYFPKSQVIDLTYGQALYDTLADALLHATSESVQIDDINIKTLNGSILRGYLIVQQGCTNLSDPAKSIIRSAGNFGTGASSSGLTGVTNHDQLMHLDYATAGHTGFMPSTATQDDIADGTNYKRLSSASKTKLDNLATIASSGSYNDLSNKPFIPSALADLSADSNNARISDAEKTKLAGIATGAEVNVQADWNAVSGDAFINNKPTIPSSLADLSTDSTHQLITAQEKTEFRYSIATGIITTGGNIIINAIDNTQIDIPAGTSLYVDNSDPLNPIIDILTWAAQTITPTNIDQSRKWIGIQRTAPGVGSIVFSSMFTALEKRTIAIRGRVWGNGSTVIEGIGQYATPAWGSEKTLEDLIDTLGSLNRSDNLFYANADLTLGKSSGTSFRFTGGSGLGLNSPNILTDVSQPNISAYHYHIAQESTGFTTLISTIDPNYYDVGGVKTIVPTGKFTIQRIFYFPRSGVIDIAYGQTYYDTLNLAIGNIPNDNIVISSANTNTLYGSILRGFLCVQQGATNLSDISQAKIVASNGIGSSGGGVSGNVVVVAGDNLQIQYNKQGVLAADQHFTWDDGAGALKVGLPTLLPNNPFAVQGSVNSYMQVNIQNTANGYFASSDIILTADDGTDTDHFADFGIGNSGYQQAAYDLCGPIDTYLMGDGGHVILGSLTPGKALKIFAANTSHECHPSDLVATLDSTGINLTSGKTYKVNGANIIGSAVTRSTMVSAMIAFGGM